MDLYQRKLSKSEWDSIEIPVSEDEISVLKLITQGFTDINIRTNKTNSLFSFLKIEYTQQMEDFLYNKHFAKRIKDLLDRHKITYVKFSNDNNKYKIKKSDSSDDDDHEIEKEPETDKDGNVICHIKISPLIKLKSGDQIRITRSDSINEITTEVYEFILVKQLEHMLNYKGMRDKLWVYNYYTLVNLMKNNIDKVNCYVKQIINTILENIEKEVELIEIIKNAYEYIERNTNLLKYGDMQLYAHQKEIFSVCKIQCPKLVLYIAPTGTGKTLTPLGLSETYKVIFVCAARHVGIALARSAISIGKKIAFAFGCSSADDIRLHYFSAKEYTRDKRSGSIKKVDNSVGDKVEMIICDIRSYLCAMYYMLSFNQAQNIITYWDEPTITMDYADHELHTVIKKNWTDNIIPNMVLSSATLPKMHELDNTIQDFKEKFADFVFGFANEDEYTFETVVKQPRIFNIASHDCRKTIPIINNNGYTVMPHYVSDDYEQVIEIVEHCEENLTLLRYFDLTEASKFIMHIEEFNLAKSSAKFERNFMTACDITMQSIKTYYLKVLKSIVPEKWSQIFNYFLKSRIQKIQHNNAIDPKGNKILKIASLETGTQLLTKGSSGSVIERTTSLQIIKEPQMPIVTPGTSAIYVTTKDAYTLTDGPTIFLASDVTKVARFCIQQANIPASVMKDIQDKIDFNNQVTQKIDSIEDQLKTAEDQMSKKMGSSGDSSNKKDSKKKEKAAGDKLDKSKDEEIIKLKEQLSMLTQMIKSATLNDLFIPNRSVHKEKWAEKMNTANSFTSNVNEDDVVAILSLNNVDDSWKVLLLLGIGVFANHNSSEYTEIMKKLADTQRLYMIIANSDYIYGTNYQFCHGYLSKDLGLTQEKIIQALGRIGRNNIQQEYSARFRDDEQIKTLFTKFASTDKPEVINMNKLFNSKM
jgi:DNA-directed RNA polymerase subunit H (RpoH/RPB5)